MQIQASIHMQYFQKYLKTIQNQNRVIKVIPEAAAAAAAAADRIWLQKAVRAPAAGVTPSYFWED